MVAGEVKELAKQTAVATHQITEQVGRIQEDVDQAVTSVHGLTRLGVGDP